MSLQFFIRYITLICIISLAVTSSAFANDLESLKEGQQAFNKGQYDKAFKAWWKHAIKGNPDAQVFVGLAHANGWGVTKDPDQAAVWYKMAAEKQHTSGQFLYGIYLLNSKNEKKVADGIKWLHQSAKTGDNEAFEFLKEANRKNWFTVSNQLLKSLNKESFLTKPAANTAFASPPQTTLSVAQ